MCVCPRFAARSVFAFRRLQRLAYTHREKEMTPVSRHTNERERKYDCCPVEASRNGSLLSPPSLQIGHCRYCCTCDKIMFSSGGVRCSSTHMLVTLLVCTTAVPSAVVWVCIALCCNEHPGLQYGNCHEQTLLTAAESSF